MDKIECENILARTSTSPEINLWRAVINQALSDLRIKSDEKREYKVYRRRAKIWLTSMSLDFIIVCQNANLSPSYIRNIAIKTIKKTSDNLKK